MKMARIAHCIVYLEENIFVLGGIQDGNNEYSNKCEKYNINKSE